MSASTLSRLLSGGEMPDLDTFATLTKWLQVDVSTFFDHEQIAVEDTTVRAWGMLYEALGTLDMPADFTEALVKLVQVVKEGQER